VLDDWNVGRVRYGNFQGRGIDSANNRADERDSGICNARCTHQDVTIPAVNAVIACASEDVQ
jgi:hypothetical protein